MTTTSPHLVVFSDDWGRHPSSCQHLIGRLLDRYPALWVNTIGTRSPRLTLEDAGKAATKLVQWLRPTRAGNDDGDSNRPANLSIVTPRMWPGFRAGWQRRFNAGAIARSVNRAMNEVWGESNQVRGGARVAITTIPITSDLIGRLEVDAWVYYCVDDFSAWPGLDAEVMRSMEAEQVGKVDAVVAVSDTLVDRLASMGRGDAALLTHGIDLDHWHQCASPQSAQPAAAAQNDPAIGEAALPAWWPRGRAPIFLFWGLIDRRLDVAWCRALAESLDHGSLVLVGPAQSPDPALAKLPGVVMPGPAAYDDLPTLAAAADVLVMPYDDLPVTRAMQPLKFKEYLATGKPVVTRDLPATQPWRDAADLATTAQAFVGLCKRRAAGGTPEGQRAARARLSEESWEMKAHAFEQVFLKSLNAKAQGR